ncbi:MAG TPA: RDD family protein [Isosphaeraceae bacterium]|jgi:hypothetical protein|nr:RDD family protein [Isosphaeraceae bacterium]
MYALKRIVAYAIDLTFIVAPMSFGLAILLGQTMPQVSEGMHRLVGIGAFGLDSLLPIVVLGVCTGLTGRTPGKLITFLRVKDCGDDPPGVAHGILREIVKAVSFGFIFGIFYALMGLVANKRTFYDQWMDLEVEDMRPSGLTPTQKKFREYMRKQGRR